MINKVKILLSKLKKLSMKKLGKLNISPDRILKNEELISLRGGYWHCYCAVVGPFTAYDLECALDMCHYYNCCDTTYCNEA